MRGGVAAAAGRRTPPASGRQLAALAVQPDFLAARRGGRLLPASRLGRVCAARLLRRLRDSGRQPSGGSLHLRHAVSEAAKAVPPDAGACCCLGTCDIAWPATGMRGAAAYKRQPPRAGGACQAPHLILLTPGLPQSAPLAPHQHDRHAHQQCSGTTAAHHNACEARGESAWFRGKEVRPAYFSQVQLHVGVGMMSHCGHGVCSLWV